MRLGPASILVVIAAVLALAYYAIEPWAVTFIDDGPYFSTEYLQPIEETPVQSQVDLRRFGRLVYIIESRTLSEGSESVLVLRNSHGVVKWARLPVKPDDELGPVEVRRAHMTWYGGWRISIKPENQEGENLYLSAFGSFRFFNHSW